jgi:pentatricopeptide repeat protein
LIDSYISSKNYKEALALLDKIKAQKINWRIKSDFYRGLSYMLIEIIKSATMLRKSIDGQIDASFTARATF